MLFALEPVPLEQPDAEGCSWWDLVCQGGQQLADSGLSAITSSLSSGLVALFGQITKIVDESTRVPLADPTYRDTYYGFATLAVPVVSVVFLAALISSALRRDLRAVSRAVVGTGVAVIGGAVYVVFAQFLIALDDWLAHGIVSVTGADFGAQMAELNSKFEAMGAGGSIAANALMLILMGFALIAGVVLWIVLLLRKMAILVVVAFAPLLIVGWLWAPTRAWARKATEVLVALVFAKTVIYMIFAIGMSMLLRGDGQTLSDFVGLVVLLCGACFAPLVTLKLVHFAADSHLAADMVGTLRAGATPAMNRVGNKASSVAHRSNMARDYTSAAHRSRAVTTGAGRRSAGFGGQPASAGSTAAPAAASGSTGAAARGAAAGGGAVAGGVGVAVIAGTKLIRSTTAVPARIGKAMASTRVTDDQSPAPTVRGPSSEGGARREHDS